VFLHSDRRIPIPDSAWRERDRLSDGAHHKTQRRANPKALVNAAKFTSAPFRIPGPMRGLNCIDKHLIFKRNFMTDFLRQAAARNCDQSLQPKKSVDIRRFF
jgi:hypothetical protein